MKQEGPSKTWIVGCFSAVAVIIAAIIGLGAPFAERLADVYFPSPTPRVNPVAPTTGIGNPSGASPSAPGSTQPAAESYDCTTTVVASRPLLAHDSGEACWLQLVDGAAAEITFNDSAQITYRTSSSGDDIYFYIAKVGDKLSDVVGATIRPSRFVLFGYGGYENIKQFEIQFHSPGGSWVACLRDANNNFQPLNSVCDSLR